MAKKFEQLKKRMKPASLRKAQAGTKEIMAEMLLAEIRKEAGFTQEDLAGAIGVKQPSLSKLERLIHALGGELEIIAHMPSGDIKISQFRT